MPGTVLDIEDTVINHSESFTFLIWHWGSSGNNQAGMNQSYGVRG